jgi:hypothetical protein
VLAKNKRAPYALETDEDWSHIILAYQKEVTKKGDDVLAEVKFPDKVCLFTQLFHFFVILINISFYKSFLPAKITVTKIASHQKLRKARKQAPTSITSNRTMMNPPATWNQQSMSQTSYMHHDIKKWKPNLSQSCHPVLHVGS